jgi:hypothetical protein
MASAIGSASEVWRAIPGNEGYEVSSLGRVRSLDRITVDGRRVRGRVLKCWAAGYRGSYQYVCLGKSVKCGVHRLVALVFHGEPPEGKPEAAHLNGNAADNRACNVVWASRSENEQHKRAHGTYQRPVNYYKPGQKKRGPKQSKHPRAAEMSRRRAEGASLDQLAAEFGMSRSGMYGVLKCRL